MKKVIIFIAIIFFLFNGEFLQAVEVSNVTELSDAVNSANSGGDKTIILNNGTYVLDEMLMIWADGVTVRSQSGNRSSVIIRGQGMYGAVSHIFNVSGTNFTVKNMTIGWVANHAIQIWGNNNSSNTLISNLRIVDTYEQMVKISYDSSSPNSSEDGIMENCLLEYSAGVGPQYYIGGIDGHQCKRWIVRNNTFKNISSPSGSVAEHAIHFWSNSEDTLAENNLIINCDRGIGFGLGSRGHIRGIIRNNMIYHSSVDYGFADVSIGLENAANVKVYNNTIYMENSYPNGIEYRFSGTSGGIIKNNLCNRAITSRDGGSASLGSNIGNAQSNWFVNISAGNLHLNSMVPQVVDQGEAIIGLVKDFDGDSRPQGSGYDIGADEYIPISTSEIEIIAPNGGEEWQVGSVQTILWSTSGTVGNVIIEFSADNGSSWDNVNEETANDGSYNWLIPNNVSTQCLIRVSEKGNLTITDRSDEVFIIKENQIQKTITVITPNGGERWESNTQQKISWISTGAVGNVFLQYTIDNENSWETIASSTSNDGIYWWTLPQENSNNCKVKISSVIDISISDQSDSPFEIFYTTNNHSELAFNYKQFNFGATSSRTCTGEQILLIHNIGSGEMNWRVTSDSYWIMVNRDSGQGEGTVNISVNPDQLSLGEHIGSLMIESDQANNSPQIISIHLKVYQDGNTSAPFGEFASPAEGSLVNSSIPVTGWILDDIEVRRVQIYNGSNLLGDAVLVEGARPDVFAAYPNYPKNYKSGWGYMLLTNFLPEGGNGNYTLSAIAIDAEGNEKILGSINIMSDNANAIKPFGAIDTPKQGGIASGSNYYNWGWALTPQPNKIPIEGETIDVYIDGVLQGHPSYNLYREDIATLFPGYLNSNGAVGFYTIDLTGLLNGVHTISWNVTDNAGNTDGIGSRYFTIQNNQIRIADKRMDFFLQDHKKDIIQKSRVQKKIFLKKGFQKDLIYFEQFSNQKNYFFIEINELDRIEIKFYEEKGIRKLKYIEGCLALENQYLSLPIGSHLDNKNGIFYWQTGPGFLGEYSFLFLNITNQDNWWIKIKIKKNALKKK